MRIEETALPGVVIVTPARIGDDRGWFCETWNASRMQAAGLGIAFVQDNHSFSARAGTLRGLHYQRPPHAQDKLVRCTRGAILDVAVDARRGAPTYGHWVAVTLTAANFRQILVPRGVLHGFVTLQDDTEVQYKCSDFYAPDCDGAVRWDSLGIDWQPDLWGGTPILSAKDAAAVRFAEFDSPFGWEGAA